ncbi:MAG: DUF192 domain-containing protein [Candidatus Paceibacterota bacterium]
MNNQITRIFIDIVIFCAFIFTSIYIYQVYGEDIKGWFTQEERIVMFVQNLAVSVTVADDVEERRMGLSHTESLEDLEGKLFVFDAEGYHRMWMKDMRFPIDMIFINNELEIVDIVENVLPETYPLTFTSSDPARFVLETNAFFAKTFKVKEGQHVIIPPRYLPGDLQENLQE